MPKEPSDALKFALIGSVAHTPRSGYDLRKQFIETPMKLFSSSPGSIYPALRRLYNQGLIAEVSPASQTGRRRQAFCATEAGLTELKEWLQKPITRADVIWSLDELMLRFVFCGMVLGTDQAIRFLHDFERQTEDYAAYLREFYQKNAPQMPVTGCLATEMGIEDYEAHARWAKRAIDRLLAENS
jgi:DNA-binding PadR family transcriptional regulator